VKKGTRPHRHRSSKTRGRELLPLEQEKKKNARCWKGERTQEKKLETKENDCLALGNEETAGESLPTRQKTARIRGDTDSTTEIQRKGLRDARLGKKKRGTKGGERA